MDEVMIVFDSTACAIRAEKVLLDGGLFPLVMPLPSRIRAGCGICLRLPPEMADRGKWLLQKQNVAWAAFYLRRIQDGASEYLPIP